MIDYVSVPHLYTLTQMYPQTRLGDWVQSYCNTPSGPFYTGSSTVFIDGLPAVRVGDQSLPGPALDGSPTIFIDGLPAVRIISIVFCGVITEGSPTTYID